MTHQFKTTCTLAATSMLIACAAVPCSANPPLVPGIWQDITPPAVATEIASNGGATFDVEVDPENPATIYLTTNHTSNIDHGAIWKSTDAGSSWNDIGNFGGITRSVGMGRMAVDPKNSQHLYYQASSPGGGAALGFWVSTDGGNNWTLPAGFKKIADSLNDYDTYCVTPDPSDFNHVLVAFHYYWFGGMNAGVVESFDGGTSWIAHDPIPGASGAGGYNVFFLYDPKLGIGNAQTWLYTTQGAGMWRTTNAGKSWVQVTTTNMVHGSNQIYYAKTGALYSGAEFYPIRSTDNGATWQQIGNGTQYAYYYSVCGDGTNVYAGASMVWSDRNGCTVFMPEDSLLTTWKNYRGGAHTLTNGPITMAYDSADQILYSSNIYALLALKVAGTTSALRGSRATTARPNSTNGPFLVLANAGSAGVLARTQGVSAFDVRGARINRAMVAGAPVAMILCPR